MARICVFTGSSSGRDSCFEVGARAFGAVLAARGHSLIYGGGRVGLMGVVAEAVLAGGGEVTGVIPRFMESREVAHTGLTGLEWVDSMHARKARMAELSDAFVALPGGWGTLDELFEILTWAQLGLHHKPVALLNLEGFFNPLLGFLRSAQEAGFVKAPHHALLHVSEEPGVLLDHLENVQPTPPPSKWA
jgi:uncharacterized protein (TIGR00730 family)